MIFPSAPIVQVVPYKPSPLRRLVRICFYIALAATAIHAVRRTQTLVERSHNPYVHPARTHRYANPPASDPH